ncbi:MAG: ATP-dependent helicase [Actinobacteria bacterium]|nr:ATP-dependent helicase [Actinomycetota bacterium]
MSGPLTDRDPYPEAPPEIIRALGGRPPTVQQWRAISHPLSPVSIVAGAGSGKTAVMAARVVYLALVAAGRVPAPDGGPGDPGGVPPSRVLCLTFTNKAAEELARRVRAAAEGLGFPEGEEATVLTYHAFAARLLEDHGLRARLEPGATLLSEAHKWQVVTSLLRDRTFDHLEVRSVEHLVRKTIGLADSCANHLVEPEEVVRHGLSLLAQPEVQADREMLETVNERIELAGLVAAYRDRKRQIGAIDYGDQIALAVRLVEEHPEVGEEFRARYAAVLLDEYQDTNVAQARLLRPLCPPGYPITAVGDPDQNIYAWRGASLFNILRFGRDFPAGDVPAPRLPLYVNFRSGSRILAVADEVIGGVPDERRAEGKILQPHPDRGDGRVVAFVASDERAEARRIAELIKGFVEGRPAGGADGDQPAWHDVAVLCRKKRLFPAISEVLRKEGIPVEVVDLGGLLRMPEVVEVLAWLRLLEDPARNVALARILQGPRWRIGFRDLARLALWSAAHNRDLSGELPGEDERPGDVAFALSESLDHLDAIDELSDEARGRLAEFREELRVLRGRAGDPLGDLVAEVVERTGLMRELESRPDAAGVSARRNLLNLIDQVAAFSPVDAEATLSTLVSWLDMAEEAEDEFEPAQPSEENTVKLLTIHKAKGLEWPAVFVPGLAEHRKWANSSIFPDTSRQPNPVTQAGTLPFELRGDAEVLPAYRGKLRPFKDELKERGLEEERRLCYVALTRARDLLVVSAAWWYEGPELGHEPGRFYLEVAGHRACEELPRDPEPEENPLLEIRRARAGTWPPAARPDDADELFPEGWHAAAELAAREPDAMAARAGALGPGVQGSFQRALAGHVERAELIRARTGADLPPPAPAAVSVTGLIDYEGCPKRYYWSEIRPLPRRPNPAARLGSRVHQWIERTGRGQATLDLDLEDLPDLSPDERYAQVAAEEATEARLQDAFRASRFYERGPPLYAERPFALFLEGTIVRGKIDAIFALPDDRWEVVDYKTGRVRPPDDPLMGLQLDVYALACREIWGKRPEELVLTYFYLASGKEVSVPAGDPDETRRRILSTVSAIVDKRYGPRPAEHCRWCDFRSFCPEGRAWMEGAADQRVDGPPGATVEGTGPPAG